MKLKSILIAGIMAIVCNTSCTTMDLEPSEWDKKGFKREVRQAMREAVNSPGIDNGSTLVVTMEGDTLLAPKDSISLLAPSRTVYVDIESPSFPMGRVSEQKMKIMIIASGIGIVALIVALVFLGIFVTIWRRQSLRNKVLNEAIVNGYELPESYFTGSPAHPSIQYISREREVCKDIMEGEPGNNTDDSEKGFETVNEEFREGIRKKIKGVISIAPEDNLRNLRNGFILAGIGVVLLWGLSIGGADVAGIIAGGSLMIIGMSKVLTVYFSKRL